VAKRVNTNPRIWYIAPRFNFFATGLVLGETDSFPRLSQRFKKRTAMKTGTGWWGTIERVPGWCASVRLFRFGLTSFVMFLLLVFQLSKFLLLLRCQDVVDLGVCALV
jgi:hypothetical protein